MRDAQNITDLSKKFDTDPYLEKTSDIVALLTLEHQTRITNLLTRLGWEFRTTGEVPERTIEMTATYMLFADEAPLLDTVEGSSTFQKTFPQRGPRDSKGRSVRDFELKTRLFRYPMTYMIYSEVFDALPAAVKERLYARLLEVLTGQDKSPKFAKLTRETRRAILEIVAETKPNVPQVWVQAARQ
jgi:hypothetical protein